MASIVRQRTLNSAIKATGITVHSGEKAELVLRPAPVNTGIVFCSSSSGKLATIPAKSDFVSDTNLSTTLANDSVRVSTVEHLLSALAGLGIDNAYIDIDAKEIPIMDGSAAPYVFLIQSAGIQEQEAPKRFIKITKPIEVREDDRFARLVPHNGFKVACEIAYNHKAFKDGRQRAELDFSATSYVKEVSRARTFGFLSDYEKIRALGLAKGSSLDNSLVMDEYRILNEDGMRFHDEPVKHKILDAIGDLYLLGSNLIGAFEGYKSGHTINYQLVTELLAKQDAWEYVTFEDGKKSPIKMFNKVYAYQS